MVRKKPYNASDAEQVEAATQMAAFESSEKGKFIQGAMTTVGGRKFFYDLLVYCSAFHTPFSADNNKTNFNCGKQSIGFMITADLQEFSPDEYIVMCREGRGG